jgi:hypothetical protein
MVNILLERMAARPLISMTALESLRMRWSPGAAVTSAVTDTWHMAGSLRRLLLAPGLIKFRLELSRLTRTSEAHQPVAAGAGEWECRACGQPDPCATQVSVDAALVRLLGDLRKLSRKALS